MAEVFQSAGATNTTPKTPAGEASRNAQWWKFDDKEQAAVVDALATRLFKQNLWRREAYRNYLRMYNKQMLNMVVSRADASGTSFGQKLSLNVVKSCSDAFTAKMTLERPKCTYLTSGGDWGLKQKAQDLDRFVDGQFYEMKLYEEAPSVVLDSCLLGTGALKIFVDGDLTDEKRAENARVGQERTPMWELAVDERDAWGGKPRTMVQEKFIDKGALCELFPKQAADIEKCVSPDSTDVWPMFGQESATDMVKVRMAWHLPSGRGATDGRYFIGLPNVTLASVEWKYHYFPFVFYRRMPPPFGFHGIGLAEELRGPQQNLNMMSQRAQEAIKNMAVPKVFIRNGTNVPVGSWTNGVDVVRGDEPPTYLVPAAILPSDFWANYEREYQRCYELTGINQLQAQAQKPSGLNSGKALDTYSDLASERFGVASRNYQDFFLDCGRQVVDRAREISSKYKKYSVISIGRGFSQNIEFLDANLDDKQAILQMYPTNRLSKDPAERMAQVEQLINGGMVDPADAPRLLEFPDLQQEWNLKYASYDLTMKIVEAILNGKKTIQPRPYMNLEEAKKWAVLKVLRAELDGCPEDRLQALREWIETVDGYIEKAKPPPAPQGMPPGPPMPGPQQAPPPPMAA